MINITDRIETKTRKEQLMIPPSTHDLYHQLQRSLRHRINDSLRSRGYMSLSEKLEVSVSWSCHNKLTSCFVTLVNEWWDNPFEGYAETIRNSGDKRDAAFGAKLALRRAIKDVAIKTIKAGLTVRRPREQRRVKRAHVEPTPLMKVKVGDRFHVNGLPLHIWTVAMLEDFDNMITLHNSDRFVSDLTFTRRQLTDRLTKPLHHYAMKRVAKPVELAKPA